MAAVAVGAVQRMMARGGPAGKTCSPGSPTIPSDLRPASPSAATTQGALGNQARIWQLSPQAYFELLNHGFGELLRSGIVGFTRVV